jgi:hypothetical protein
MIVLPSKEACQSIADVRTMTALRLGLAACSFQSWTTMRKMSDSVMIPIVTWLSSVYTKRIGLSLLWRKDKRFNFRQFVLGAAQKDHLEISRKKSLAANG